MTTEHVSSAMGDLVATAISLAAKNNLVCEDGTIVCWACREYRALLPSLHCHQCLADHHRRSGTVGLCMNREQTPSDAAAARVTP
jgi:hypothetical protein